MTAPEEMLAIEEAFEVRKSRVLERGALRAPARLAAFLAAESSLRSYEGLDPSTAADALASGAVASLLQLDEATLAVAVRELEELGLIEQAEAGTLRLTDMEQLARFVHAAR
jgi:hypothetical protein